MFVFWEKLIFHLFSVSYFEIYWPLVSGQKKTFNVLYFFWYYLFLFLVRFYATKQSSVSRNWSATALNLKMKILLTMDLVDIWKISHLLDLLVLPDKPDFPNFLQLYWYTQVSYNSINYRRRTIITRGLYTFYPIFEGQKRF